MVTNERLFSTRNSYVRENKDQLKMLTNTSWEATYLATLYALKLAILLETFKASSYWKQANEN
jgi:hypothetical protein